MYKGCSKITQTGQKTIIICLYRNFFWKTLILLRTRCQSIHSYVVYVSDPPPSYESLFGKIKRAKAESSGRVDFAKKSCSICTESGTSTIVQCISRKSSKDINTIIGGQHYTLLYQYIKIYKDNITIIGRQHCV